jgi:hypothetical protein
MIGASNLMSRVLKPAAVDAGIGQWVGFHTLRHTCATIAFRHGANAKQVQLWLGHHSPAFTLTTYVHLLPDDLPDPAFLDTVTAGNKLATRPAETCRNQGEAKEDKTLAFPGQTKPAEVAAAYS